MAFPYDYEPVINSLAYKRGGREGAYWADQGQPNALPGDNDANPYERGHQERVDWWAGFQAAFSG